jgi:hypothetical protein
MARDPTHTCGTCRFHDAPTKECRRRAPFSLPGMVFALCEALCSREKDLDAVVSSDGDWPSVRDTDWCGEYQADE